MMKRLFIITVLASLLFLQGCIHLDNTKPDVTEINVTNFSPYSNTTASQYARMKALESSLRRHVEDDQTRPADSVRVLIDALSSEVWIRLERDLRSTLDTIPNLNYALSRATGMYLGDREPSMVVVLQQGETPLSRRAVHAVSMYARNEAQQSMIVSQPVVVSSNWIGETEDGMTYEPSFTVSLVDAQTVDRLSEVLVANGFPGFTIRHTGGRDQLDIYYVPEFETDANGSGRSREQFMSEADLLAERLRQLGFADGHRQAVRRLRLVELGGS
jgi:hypothetical protein